MTSSTHTSSESQTTGTAGSAVAFRLEVAVLPVTDAARARDFYLGLGWRLDADIDPGGGYHAVQVTPPGSNASIILGTGVTTARPGAGGGLLLAVDDIEVAHAQLVSQGVAVSEIFHDAGGSLGGGFVADPASRAAGPDPERRSYASYATFDDPDGNRWLLQELTQRLPGRV
jgi:catechol 2,3-dioxygenase-like lactoylglutathione lyase family enzyme